MTRPLETWRSRGGEWAGGRVRRWVSQQQWQWEVWADGELQMPGQRELSGRRRGQWQVGGAERGGRVGRGGSAFFGENCRGWQRAGVAEPEQEKEEH